MKTFLIPCVFFLAILILSACKSDYEKYHDMKVQAARSQVTELETPEGFRFDMDEDAVNEKLRSFPQREFNYRTYKELLLGTDTFLVELKAFKYYEGKLCSYDISIENKTNYNLDNIFDHYKVVLKDYQFESKLGQGDFDYDYYGFTKGNLFIEITKDKYYGDLRITCENRPIAIKLNDNTKVNATPIITPMVEVKNNKWNGGVKQVEDYLERTLRDPDSYESIEWSEVKRKDDGYYVRHKYRAKNGFGGYVVTNQLFHLDFNGNVVDVKDLF